MPSVTTFAVVWIEIIMACTGIFAYLVTTFAVVWIEICRMGHQI